MKDTKNKLNWNLINLKGLEGLIKIREYGLLKYRNPNNWKSVKPEDYFNALKRHLVEMDDNGIYSTDKESGLRHIDHAICNLYFIGMLEND